MNDEQLVRERLAAWSKKLRLKKVKPSMFFKMLGKTVQWCEMNEFVIVPRKRNGPINNCGLFTYFRLYIMFRLKNRLPEGDFTWEYHRHNHATVFQMLCEDIEDGMSYNAMLGLSGLEVDIKPYQFCTMGQDYTTWKKNLAQYYKHLLAWERENFVSL